MKATERNRRTRQVGLIILGILFVTGIQSGCDGFNPLDTGVDRNRFAIQLDHLDIDESDLAGIDLERMMGSLDFPHVTGILADEPGKRSADRHRARIVSPDESLQEAIDAAAAGQTVLIRPGTYVITETILIDKSIHLIGIGQPGEVVIRDAGSVDNGILARNVSGLTLANLTIRGFSRNGVFAVNVDGFVFHRLVTDQLGQGAYGLFPVRSTNGLIIRCTATGADDAGVYVGQSENVAVLHNIAYENVIGFEAENVRTTVWAHNEAFDNAAGMLGILLPPSIYITELHADELFIRHNRFVDNNHVNFAEQGDLASFVPSGTGLLVFGYDDSTVEKNDVSGNAFVGIGLGSTVTLWTAAGRALEDLVPIEPHPDRVTIRQNDVRGNGSDNPVSVPGLPAPVPAVDLFWDAPILALLESVIPDYPFPGVGEGNCWDNNEADTRFPETLPFCDAVN